MSLAIIQINWLCVTIQKQQRLNIMRIYLLQGRMKKPWKNLLEDGSDMIEEGNIKKFKKVILEMYNGFPNVTHYGKVEKAVISSEMRDKLVEKGYLIKEIDRDMENKPHTGYALGPNALPLVCAWKNEELTKRIKYLTIVIAFLTIVLVIFQLFFFLVLII